MPALRFIFHAGALASATDGQSTQHQSRCADLNVLHDECVNGHVLLLKEALSKRVFNVRGEQTQTMMMFMLAESDELDLAIMPIEIIEVIVKNARLEAREKIFKSRGNVVWRNHTTY